MFRKEQIVVPCGLLLLIGIAWLNSLTYANQVDLARASMAEATNTPAYNYLPIVLKPAGTPTATATATATATSIPSPADIQIIFIEYNPDGSDVDGEYVRLQNMGATAHDMTDWTLRDAVNTVFTFPNFTLQSSASVSVWVKSGSNSTTDLYWGRGSSVWTNTGDTATLRDDLGQEADSCTYTGGGSSATCP